MQIINKQIKELIPYINNARTHSDEQITKIASSIKEFGFNNPILIDKDNGVIAGHGRLEAAKLLGLKEVPTIALEHLTDTQRKAYILADNRMALDAGWDSKLLSLELASLKEEDFDLFLTGFSEDEIDAVFNIEELELQAEEDDCPEVPADPITKLGDIWILGNHRLMCGDSTNIQNVEKLMNGTKADMVFADPPYGINEETDRDFVSNTRKTKGNTFPKIIGDDSIDTAIESFSIADSLAPIVCYWGGNYYAHKLPPSPCWIVWDKRVEDNQRDMNSDCELAYIKHPNKKSIRIFRHLWKGMIKASEQGNGRVHPTQKPVTLAEWCFEELAPESEIIIDLFGGSGSCLIACENTDRKCFVMELDPKYCDVIIKRWQDFTGKKAKHEETGKNFDQM